MVKKNEAVPQTIACPLARTARLVGDEWILLILRELFKRPHKFDELQKACGAATNILTNRLQRMLDAGLIKKTPYQERPPRFQYQLARAGYDRATIATGKKPDAAFHDRATGLIAVMNAGDGNVTLIDPRTRTLAGSIAVGGALEFAVADGHGGARA